MARIGFVEIGNMGGPMASNLVRAGHAVAVLGLDGAAMARIADARAASSAADAVGGADFVPTMLPAGPQVRDAFLGAGDMATASAPEAVLIDCSTIDVATARDVARGCGRAFLDAPVSGGVMGAEAATLACRPSPRRCTASPRRRCWPQATRRLSASCTAASHRASSSTSRTS